MLVFEIFIRAYLFQIALEIVKLLIQNNTGKWKTIDLKLARRQTAVPLMFKVQELHIVNVSVISLSHYSAQYSFQRHQQGGTKCCDDVKDYQRCHRVYKVVFSNRAMQVILL